ncbi:MAG: DUF6221 family protein [Actinomycetota bacterium]|nr:DUF6221 family protein [Actinomycetota bacterium]
MDLIEFLNARLDEDEYAALPFHCMETGETDEWRCDEVGGAVRTVRTPPFGLSDVIAQSDIHAPAVHIARWDPARVLADVEAKRRTLSEHAPVESGAATGGYLCRVCLNPATTGGWAEDWYPQTHPCQTVRLLALPFAAHPDYREEWRP